MDLNQNIFQGLKCFVSSTVLLLGISACAPQMPNQASTALGLPIAPENIKDQDFADVPGQLYGIWKINYPQDQVTKVDQVEKIYFKKNSAIFRMTCSKNGKIVADLAGEVATALSATTIRIKQNLDLKKSDCTLKVVAQDYSYHVQASGASETALIGSNGLSYTYQRAQAP